MVYNVLKKLHNDMLSFRQFISSLFLCLIIPLAQADLNENFAGLNVLASSNTAPNKGKKISNSKISIEQLLLKYARHGSEQLFKGTFVYAFEGNIQTIRVHRDRNSNGEIIEYFTPIDQVKKATSRSLSNQFCLLENNWPYAFQSISSSFPFRVNNFYRELEKNYTLSLIKEKIVAGISAIGILIQANDSYRYGYELWFEPETATLLKYKLMAQKEPQQKGLMAQKTAKKITIEQYLFTDITLSQSGIQDHNNRRIASAEACVDKFTNIKYQFTHYFDPVKIPKGFEPVSFREGLIHASQHKAHQFQFSDGLSTVSVFIEDTNPKRKPVNGIMKLGPVTVAGKTMNTLQVTVIGVIPVMSALRFLDAIAVTH